MYVSPQRVAVDVRENLLNNLDDLDEEEIQKTHDYVDQMMEDLNNYNVNSFYKYYEFYYKEVLFAQIMDLERQVFDIFEDTA